MEFKLYGSKWSLWQLNCASQIESKGTKLYWFSTSHTEQKYQNWVFTSINWVSRLLLVILINCSVKSIGLPSNSILWSNFGLPCSSVPAPNVSILANHAPSDELNRFQHAQLPGWIRSQFVGPTPFEGQWTACLEQSYSALHSFAHLLYSRLLFLIITSDPLLIITMLKDPSYNVSCVGHIVQDVNNNTLTSLRKIIELRIILLIKKKRSPPNRPIWTVHPTRTCNLWKGRHETVRRARPATQIHLIVYYRIENPWQCIRRFPSQPAPPLLLLGQLAFLSDIRTRILISRRRYVSGNRLPLSAISILHFGFPQISTTKPNLGFSPIFLAASKVDFFVFRLTTEILQQPSVLEPMVFFSIFNSLIEVRLIRFLYVIRYKDFFFWLYFSLFIWKI